MNRVNKSKFYLYPLLSLVLFSAYSTDVHAFNFNPVTYFRSKAEIKRFSSQLPLFNIDTNGQTILRNEKIVGKLSLVNHLDKENTTDELANPSSAWTSDILVRRRGQSSDGFPQKQYLVEFTKSEKSKEDVDIPLLGLTKDDQWVFHAPYVDKSLMRNALAYALARRLTNSDGTTWYAPRTQFAELLINTKYRGIYTVTEKIGPGKQKVDIKRFDSKKSIAHDVILKVNPISEDDIYFTTKSGISLIYEYPGKNKLSTFKEKHPKKYKKFLKKNEDIFNHFENILANNSKLAESDELEQYVDFQSFVNYILIQEVLKNIDGYRRSVYLHIKDGKIYAGPVWDFNLAMGNLWFYNQRKPDGWQHNRNYVDGNKEVFWYQALLKNRKFRNILISTYTELRKGGNAFDRNQILNMVDRNVTMIGNVEKRHFTKWNLLGSPLPTFWFSPPRWPMSYEGEIKKLKSWFSERLDWIDKNINQI